MVKTRIMNRKKTQGQILRILAKVSARLFFIVGTGTAGVDGASFAAVIRSPLGKSVTDFIY
jgi:hypothetical protein